LGKLKVLSGQQVCLILVEYGFHKVRQKTSHIVMQRKLVGSTVTVPVPNHSEIRLGTLMSIIRQSGISRSVFEV